MKKYKIIGAAVLLLALAAAIAAACAPETVVLYKDARWESGTIGEVCGFDNSIETSGGAVVPTKAGNYKVSLSFLGVKYKDVTLKVLEEKEVCPGGEILGIRLYSDGLIVVAFGRLSENGKSPAERAGLKIGDVILSANGVNTDTAEDLTKIAETADSVELEVKRGETAEKITVTPEVSSYDGKRRLGLWVRNSTAGVGTLTYVAEDGSYGALGHSISDSDTGVVFDVLKGSVEKCGVSEITKSQKGAPGEIKGVFYQNAEPMGGIEKNTDSGIYGKMLSVPTGERVKVGLKSEIKKGAAVIRTSLDGETAEEYAVKILRVSPSDKNPSKGILLEVTDERLLEKTGGIVQGMSGSPILQDGKLIGAVTHVLVNDPKRGYGVTAEAMISAQ